jgi:hypothetical protein
METVNLTHNFLIAMPGMVDPNFKIGKLSGQGQSKRGFSFKPRASRNEKSVAETLSKQNQKVNGPVSDTMNRAAG